MLAAKFPKGKNEEPTTFKRTFNKLTEEQVSFPNDYKFVTAAGGVKSTRNDPMAESKR